jgi:hypothetical protein
MNCYKCSKNLCEISVDCDNTGVIDINQLAAATGTYTLELNFMEKAVIKKNFDFNLGESLIFEMPFLNENYCYDFKVRFNGNVLSFQYLDKLVSNFNFCTKKEWVI